MPPRSPGGARLSVPVVAAGALLLGALVVGSAFGALMVIGGLMLGYGARLAFGCNIGAYFGGIASGSLHGWVWLVAAFAGNMLGVKLRPFFFGGGAARVSAAKGT